MSYEFCVLAVNSEVLEIRIFLKSKNRKIDHFGEGKRKGVVHKNQFCYIQKLPLQLAPQSSNYYFKTYSFLKARYSIFFPQNPI